MNKISKRWTIGVLILAIVGAAFLATLYFTPYYRVDYTRFSNVKTDFRKSSEYMLDDNVALIISNKTELEKLEKKSLVTFIYVGKPTAEFRKKLGNESRIQLNDSYAEVAAIQDYIIGERASMKEEDQPQMTVSLKVDQDTKMGIVTDIKEALRKAYALKINYSAQPRQ